MLTWASEKLRRSRGEIVYPGGYQRVILREENLCQRGFSKDWDWLECRQLRGHDFYAIEKLRSAEHAWLAPWEAGAPPGLARTITMDAYISGAAKSAREGQGLYFAILPAGRLAGQVSLSSVQRGAAQTASIGYWIASRFAGKGLTPLAVAMVLDWCFTSYGLHRVEINIRPENAASLRVVEKLGLREEGRRSRYLYINEAWCDHRSFAVTLEEWKPGIFLENLLQK